MIFTQAPSEGKGDLPLECRLWSLTKRDGLPPCPVDQYWCDELAQANVPVAFEAPATQVNWPSQQWVDGGGIEPPGLLPRRRQGSSHAARCRASAESRLSGRPTAEACMATEVPHRLLSYTVLPTPCPDWRGVGIRTIAWRLPPVVGGGGSGRNQTSGVLW